MEHIQQLGEGGIIRGGCVRADHHSISPSKVDLEFSNAEVADDIPTEVLACCECFVGLIFLFGGVRWAIEASTSS